MSPCQVAGRLCMFAPTAMLAAAAIKNPSTRTKKPTTRRVHQRSAGGTTAGVAGSAEATVVTMSCAFVRGGRSTMERPR